MPSTPQNPVIEQLRVLAELHTQTSGMGYWNRRRHPHSYYNHLLACSFPAVTAANRTAEGEIPEEGDDIPRNDIAMSLAGVIAATCWHTGNTYEDTLEKVKINLAQPAFTELLKTLTANNLCAVEAQGGEYKGPILHFVEEQLELLAAQTEGETQ